MTLEAEISEERAITHFMVVDYT